MRIKVLILSFFKKFEQYLKSQRLDKNQNLSAFNVTHFPSVLYGLSLLMTVAEPIPAVATQNFMKCSWV